MPANVACIIVGNVLLNPMEGSALVSSYIAQDWLHVCAWDVIGARWVYLDGLEKGHPTPFEKGLLFF
jgi:hypothetical protein